MTTSSIKNNIPKEVVFSEIQTRSRKSFEIRGSIEIDASSIQLWKIITAASHLKNYHPFCKSHKAAEFTAVGDRDEGEFYNGQKKVREVITWLPEEGYSVRLLNFRDSKKYTDVHFRIEPSTETRSIFHLKLESKAYENVPRPIWFFIAKFLLVPTYKQYIRSVLKGLEFFATSHVPVKKNQFGSSWMFSS